MLLLVLLAVVQGQDCRPFLCKSTSLGTCASLTSTSIAIQTCPGDLVCDYVSDVGPKMNYTDYTVPCLPDSQREHPYTFKLLIEGVDNICNMGLTASTPRLVEQSNFKLCQQDQDCLLTNGSYTPCVCGMNGTRYCTYGPGDDVFVEFSKAACDKDWNKYLLLGVYATLQGNVYSYPNCTPEVLTDFAYFVYLRDGGDVYQLFGVPTHALLLVPVITLAWF